MGTTVVTVASFAGRGALSLETDEGDVHFLDPDGRGAALLVAGALVTAWRRQAPFPVLLTSSTALFAYVRLGYAPPPLPYSVLIALYTVTAIWNPRRSAALCGVLVVGFVAGAYAEVTPFTDDEFLAYGICLASAWALGYAVQLSRAQTALLQERSDQVARSQAATTALAVERERARIARELHDIVAHHVSVIVAQSAAAQRAPASGPLGSAAVLGSIEAMGREALVEMRRMLGLLQPDTIAELRPPPTLDQLDELAVHVTLAGVAVDLSVLGAVRPLPAAVELNAYRIVQEALTNVLKHAQADNAWVHVAFGDAQLVLRVADDGHGMRGTSGGYGLVGMRQRVEMLGGSLTVGSQPGGGFLVEAHLPLDPGARPDADPRSPVAGARGGGLPVGP
ncbi:MAG TPA: sensor histidine kinase [Dermatophilaceae bacterium]|nr:sensor histidine kinase [Dermatophilaceae bacterium]